MTIKTLLFSLFLYVALVWVWAAYSRSGTELEEFGLLWTAVGLVILLLGIIVTRLFGWWRLRRARATERPPTPVKVAPVVRQEDASLAALIAEANTNLAKAPGYVQRGPTPLSGMPLYLLIGPEVSGKTSVFLSSGLDPHLLAGQSAGTVSGDPCSLWFANNVIFAEVSGRAFGGDLNRWTELLKMLRGEAPVPWWRRLWSEPHEGLALRGVVGFCDVKDFTAASDNIAAEHRSRNWQERLGVIGEVFGVEFPVYQVITKCDTILYFQDFFRRLPESEVRQVLGCTLPFGGSEATGGGTGFVEQQGQKLTRAFRSLYTAMATRRIVQLIHEPDPSKRPAIYEFPRELNRIRRPLVQFLSNAFRPHPLRLGPLFKGFFLTGLRQVEAAAVGLGDTRINWSFVKSGDDATRVFSADATRILRADEAGKRPYNPSGLTMQRMFVADLFRGILVTDQTGPKPKRVDPRMEQYRRVVFGMVLAICVLLCFAWFWSWLGNRELLHEAESAAAKERQTQGRASSLVELQALEDLRVQAARLTDYHRNGPPLGLRWGLYSGNSVESTIREIYFRRFEEIILNPLNEIIVARLHGLPANPGPSDPYDPVYDLLKAHLMIACDCCKAEPAFLSSLLKQVRDESHVAVGLNEGTLIDHQIDSYASELPFGNPIHVTEDESARDHARQYLLSIRGIDRIYQAILNKAEQTLAKPQRLGDLAPDYATVMRGSGEVKSVFTPEGWRLVEKESKEGNRAALGDSCVVGGISSLVNERQQDADLARQIQSKFLRDYILNWRNFVAGFSVERYNSPEDAARRLEILTGHRSPLLAVFAMTANQTNFASGSSQPGFIESKVPVLGKIFKAGKKAESTGENLAGAHANLPPVNPNDITRSFQPVDWVVPPNSDTWVVEKNSAYIDALSQLGHSMEEVARTSDNPDPSVHQAASQNYDKAMAAVHQIAQGFKPVGVEGVDVAVQQLLEEPIRLTKPFIITDIGKATGGKINGELHAFCSRLRNTTRKYPFQQSSDEVTLLELANAFAPITGSVWKFQAEVLGELTVKDGAQWKAKDPAKKPQVTPGMLAFLNRAQSITDAFYPAGATQTQLTYTLRPKLDSSFKDSTLELEIDGHVFQWTTSLQKQFTWPAPPGTQDLGAVARVRAGVVTIPVASRGGLWGIFRIMSDAEPRPLNSKTVEWKNLRGGDGRLEAIQPAPVRIEIVEFPGGHDLFNPTFFDGLQCPAYAVQ